MAQDFRGIPFASLPEASDPDFNFRLKNMLSTIDLWARDASQSFGRINLGQLPNGSGTTIASTVDLSGYFFLGGRLGGQIAIGGVNQTDYLSLRGNTSGLLPVTGNGLVRVTSPVVSTGLQTNKLFGVEDSAGSDLFTITANGAVTITERSTFTSGNPIMLDMQMTDSVTTFSSSIMRVRIGSTSVFTLSYTGDLFMSGALSLEDPGAGTGLLTLQAASPTTSHTLTLPGTQGGASTILTNDGAGALSWSTNAAVVDVVRTWATLQTFKVPSMPPEASSRPSGEKAIDTTASEWPRRMLSLRPVAKSTSVIRSCAGVSVDANSRDTNARSVPSGEKANGSCSH